MKAALHQAVPQNDYEIIVQWLPIQLLRQNRGTIGGIDRAETVTLVFFTLENDKPTNTLCVYKIFRERIVRTSSLVWRGAEPILVFILQVQKYFLKRQQR